MMGHSIGRAQGVSFVDYVYEPYVFYAPKANMHLPEPPEVHDGIGIDRDTLIAATILPHASTLNSRPTLESMTPADEGGEDPLRHPMWKPLHQPLQLVTTVRA
ncbi:hypothetical protein AOQ72_16800 [Bradyrhizobium yuanmingense]|uniref:Uncharacterized protein n=1 Tax=Bradyrhizobium yuanmingense TaxID=108015 RepID=A0A0R3CM14_9BRAD|nr:hypothetical protein AOQ72_16800 [Bradyrhizobium yuanmingense]